MVSALSNGDSRLDQDAVTVSQAGLRIIGITYPPEKISDVRRFVRKVGINYQVAVGTKATKALFSQSDTLPMTVVIDREVNVRDVVEGILYRDEFEQKVKPLLSKSSCLY